MKTTTVISYFLLCLFFGRWTGATPPNLTDAAYMPICRDGDRVAFFAMANTNLGSHYVDSTRFALLLLDTATGEYEIGRLGGLDLSDEFKTEADERKVIPGEKNGLVQQLNAWGTDRCLWVSESYRHDPPDSRFTYGLSESGLAVMFKDRVQTVKVGIIFDPAREIAEMRLEGSFEKPVPLGPSSPVSDASQDAPADFDFSQVVTAELELSTRTLFLFRLEGDFGVEPDRDHIVVAETAKLNRAKAWLINAYAFEELHRKGEWPEAVDLFEKASQLDPENPTPRYNGACARARQQRSHESVALLRTLPPTAGLRAKIARDPDFEAIRGDAKFVAFVDSLPKK